MTLFSLLSAPRRPDLYAVAELFAREAASDGAAIMLSDGAELTVASAYPPHSHAEAALRVPHGQGMTGQVARNAHAIRLAADAPRTPAFRELIGLAEHDTVARLCLPLRGIDGQIVGVVSLWRGTDLPYDDAEITALQPYADLVGIRVQARRLLEAVDSSYRDRDQLMAAAVSAQEAERRRIASDLHDGVTTALASMAFHLDAASRSIVQVERAVAGDEAAARAAVGAAREQLTAAGTLADLAYSQTRAAITGLHSLVLDDLGLVAALESLAKTAPGVDVAVSSDPGDSLADVPNHAAAALYRIAQETLSNAVRHAHATQITLSLTRTPRSVVLTTTDNGTGFDVRANSGRPVSDGDDRGHFGLASIAERCALIGASLRIDSGPGRGTAIAVDWPTS